MNHNRRTVIAVIGLAPVALLAPRSSQAVEAVCYDPAALTLAERRSRRGLGFVESGADPKKRCGGCAFFVKGAGNCGTCQMMAGGRVTALGNCTSFAQKPT